MKPSAVMEKRAPSRVSSDTAAQALWRELDYFPTPPWAARAIAHRIKQNDPGAMTAYDGMCGEGHFAGPCREVFGDANVFASDIYAFGYGDHFDLFDQGSPLPEADWWLTNPAFVRAAQFIELGLARARRGVAVLCRTAFLESEGREKLLWESAQPLTQFMPFVERVPMQLGSWDPNGSTATSYSVFVFRKTGRACPPQPFLSGTRHKYSFHDDAARYAKAAPIPLFEKMAPPPLFQQGRP